MDIGSSQIPCKEEKNGRYRSLSGFTSSRHQSHNAPGGIKSQNGSWTYNFEYDPTIGNITIKKGSVTVNGVSLTVVNSKNNGFSVAIIPYTYEHTNFKHFKIGSVVNLEFDVIGKYVSRLYAKNTTS